MPDISGSDALALPSAELMFLKWVCEYYDVKSFVEQMSTDVSAGFSDVFRGVELQLTV